MTAYPRYTPKRSWRVHVMRATGASVTTSTLAHQVDALGNTVCGMNPGGTWLPAAISMQKCPACRSHHVESEDEMRRRLPLTEPVRA